MLALHFFIGFITSYLGFTPPSMLNLTVSKILLEKDKKAARQFILGASLIVLLQFFIGYIIISSIKDFPDILFWIKNIAILLFAVISVYFLTKKKIEGEEIKLKKYKNNFIYGVTLSLINMFAIPFFTITYSVFMMKGFVNMEGLNVTLFGIGVFVGVVSVLSSYIVLMKKFKQSLLFLTKFINPVIGTITGFFAIYSAVKLYF